MSYTPAAPNYGGNNNPQGVYQNYNNQAQGGYQGGYQQPAPQAPPPRTASAVPVSQTQAPAQINTPARTAQEFFQICDMLTNNINLIRNNTDQIRTLNQRSLGEVNINLVADMKRQVDRLCEDTSSLVTSSRSALKVLSQSKTPQPPAAVKNQQYARLAATLKDATRTFFRVENEVKVSARDQFARQYRIARPQASEAEIEHAIANGTSDVFSQELVSSRIGEQRRQLESVQDRARALQRIQNSMAELLRIVEELDAEIDKQQVFIDEIETHVESTVVNADQGVRQLEQGVRLAQGARKKQMWIFIIIVVVLVVIGGGIGIYIGVQRASNNNNNKK
ncbi:Plasma membrane t-SNARE, secretory vesicle fusion [Phlyctochytrium bullatum]|nr:Plasma membrane t-SNARE, secretory vesicle fusion [Phlyctochytrium bullatum]